MNIRLANGLGRVHVAKPGLKETYCGRPVNEEDWLTTSREANCTVQSGGFAALISPELVEGLFSEGCS
jgi:hypothetical protein